MLLGLLGARSCGRNHKQCRILATEPRAEAGFGTARVSSSLLSYLAQGGSLGSALVLGALLLTHAGCSGNDPAAPCEPGDTTCEETATPDPEAPGGDKAACGTCSSPNRPFCEAESGTCVACLSHLDCNRAEQARCNPETFSCASCTSDSHCENIAGKPVCDLSDGVCVACTATQHDTCGTRICDLETRTCGELRRGSARACEPCVASAQCQEGQSCVTMQWNPGGAPGDDGDVLGTFCLWNVSATRTTERPLGDCRLKAPYIFQRSRNLANYFNSTDVFTVEGTTVSVCAPDHRTTCEALVSPRRFDDCAPTGTPDHTLCGVEGILDAYCAPYTQGAFACTTPCNGDAATCFGQAPCREQPITLPDAPTSSLIPVCDF